MLPSTPHPVRILSLLLAAAWITPTWGQTAVGSSVYRSEDLAAGLVAHFPLDGTAADATGNGHDGTVFGAVPAQDRFGNACSAYAFDGVDDFIEAIADGLPTAERTVALWFNAESVAQPVLISYGGGSCGTSWFMGINAAPALYQDSLYVTAHCDAHTLAYGYATGPEPFGEPVGRWIHWAAVTDQDGTRLYLDGVEVASNTDAIVDTDVVGRELSLGVATSPGGFAPYTDSNVGHFQGRLDDVRIYDRALSAAEIDTLATPGPSQSVLRLPRTNRLSLSEAGEQGSGDSQALPWSTSCGGRRVAFHSAAQNLTPIDGNGLLDVFVRDVPSNMTIPVSVASNGNEMGDGASRNAGISSDGRYACFMSAATNLCADTNGAVEDIFVRDLQTGTTCIVSVSSSGAQGDLRSSTPSISSTGRFVVFESLATNLDESLPMHLLPSGSQTEVYIHDRDADEDGVFDEPGSILTRIASIDSGRTMIGERCENPTVSSDGRRVAFEAQSSLHPDDMNVLIDCYVHDRDSDGNGIFDEPGLVVTAPVSRNTMGSTGDGNSARPFLSANGLWIAFMSEASDLLPGGDTNGDYDAYYCGLAGFPLVSTLVRVSELPGHVEAASPDVQYVSISGEGRFIAFDSTASLLPRDTNAHRDVFLYDTMSSTLQLMSVNNRGQPGNDFSGLPSVSPDGVAVSFSSVASNLVSGDTNEALDVFLRDISRLRLR